MMFGSCLDLRLYSCNCDQQLFRSSLTAQMPTTQLLTCQLLTAYLLTAEMLNGIDNDSNELKSVQAEADFSGLAARLRDGEGRAADTDRAAREALQRCAQAEAQLHSTEVQRSSLSHEDIPLARLRARATQCNACALPIVCDLVNGALYNSESLAASKLLRLSQISKLCRQGICQSKWLVELFLDWLSKCQCACACRGSLGRCRSTGVSAKLRRQKHCGTTGQHLTILSSRPCQFTAGLLHCAHGN